MKNSILFIIFLMQTLFIFGCNKGKPMTSKEKIVFATSAEYPPFEYMENTGLKGFDIDLARLITKKLGKSAQFENMQFSAVLPALSTGRADAAISTITITPERQKNILFSLPYYFDGMTVLFPKGNPVNSGEALAGKIVAAQLGSTMALWLKAHASTTKIITMDNNNQAIAALKAGQVDAVLVDAQQGCVFGQKNPELASARIGGAEQGYAFAFPQNSNLAAEINPIIQKMQASGEIKALEEKWFGEASCQK